MSLQWMLMMMVNKEMMAKVTMVMTMMMIMMMMVSVWMLTMTTTCRGDDEDADDRMNGHVVMVVIGDVVAAAVAVAMVVVVVVVAAAGAAVVAKGMLLLNGAVDGLLLPFDCVKLRSADDPALSLGFDFAKTSAKCMKKPVPCYGIRSCKGCHFINVPVIRQGFRRLWPVSFFSESPVWRIPVGETSSLPSGRHV
eukprot:s1303_g10.t2